jgi:hypothetical protein
MDITTAFTISVCFLSLSALVNILSGSVINKIGRRNAFLYGKYVHNPYEEKKASLTHFK